MRTREITHDHWQSFFADFTHLHQGECINVETMGEESGLKSHLCDEPLVGIVAAADPSAGAEDWIELIAGRSSAGHAGYSIRRPIKVRVAEEENGEAVALQIESADGVVTMIRFEPPREGMPQGFTVV